MGLPSPQLLLHPARVRWIEARELTEELTVSCVDGRHASCTIGAPGGNAGELVIMLSVIEWYLRRELDDAELANALSAWVDALGRFYMHTDRHALAALGAKLGLDVEATESLVRNPPHTERAALREALTDPTHVGCGHLRALLERPEIYRVRVGLVRGLMRAFFDALWRDARVEWAVLEGQHAERAVLVFHSREPVEDDSVIPSVCSFEGEPQVFTHHVPALRYLRRKSLETLIESRAIAGLESLPKLEVMLEVERLAERHLDLTLSALAPDIERHRVEFDRACELRLHG